MGQMDRVSLRSKQFLVCCCMVYCGSLIADGWNVTPFLSLKEVYSDNIEHRNAMLATDDFVTELAPGFNAQLDTSRMQADIFYRLQSLYYSQDSDSHETHQQLNATLDMEILQDAIFMDTRASRAQQIIDPEKPVSLRNLAVSNNRADVATASVNPYWRNRWAGYMESLISVRSAKVDYDETRHLAILDSRINSTQLNLSFNNDSESDWGIDIGFNNDNITYENQIENEFRQSFIKIRTQFGGKTALFLTLGDEVNKFQTLDQTLPEGSFWALALQVKPSKLHHIEVSVGDRFFGSTHSFEWLYSGHRWDIGAHYGKDFFTDAQRQLQTGGRLSGQFSETDLSQASTGVYLRSRTEADIAYRWSKTQMRLGVFSEDREFQSIQREDILQGGFLSWNWRLAPHTHLLTEYRSYRDQLNISTLDNRVYQLSTGLRRQINKQLHATLELGRERLISSIRVNDYEENWLSISVEQAF